MFGVCAILFVAWAYSDPTLLRTEKVGKCKARVWYNNMSITSCIQFFPSLDNEIEVPCGLSIRILASYDKSNHIWGECWGLKWRWIHIRVRYVFDRSWYWKINDSVITVYLEGKVNEQVTCPVIFSHNECRKVSEYKVSSLE